MGVLVRINVRGIVSDQPAKIAQLALQFCGNNSLIIERNDLVKLGPAFAIIGPFAKIEVKSQAQLWMFAAVRNGGSCVRPAHHQAGTCDNSMIVGFDNPPIHTLAEAVIVGVDNEKPCRIHIAPHQKEDRTWDFLSVEDC